MLEPKAPKTLKRPKRVKRYNWKQYFPLFLLGVIFIVLFALGKQSSNDNTVAQNELINIPVPKRNIAKGEKIIATDWALLQIPRSKTTSEHVFTLKNLEGTETANFLPKNVPVLQSSLVTKANDMNAVVEGIPESMRAITVKVDAESAVEGWARSGNFVDVIVIKESKLGGPEAKVIAENVKILSAGRTVKQSSNYSSTSLPATITLLVSQEDALKIKTATSVGKLTFSLRGNTDNIPTQMLAMNQKILLYGDKKEQRIVKGRFTSPNGKKYILTDSGEWEEE